MRKSATIVGAPFWVAVLIVTQASASDPIRMEENFPEGCQYHVNCRVDVHGNLSIPSDKEKSSLKSLAVKGNSIIDYDERVLTVSKNGQVEKTLRIYRTMDFQRSVGDRPQDGS